MRLAALVLSLLLAPACAIGYASGDRAIGFAVGDATLAACNDDEECPEVSGGTLSEPFTDLFGRLFNAITGAVGGAVSGGAAGASQ